MGKKMFMIVFAFFLYRNIFAQANQDSSNLSLKGLFVSQTIISPGYFFYKGLLNSYFHPALEYFFEDKVSIRTDAFYFLTTQGDEKPLRMNHQMLLGAFYHFQKKSGSICIGWQPGAAYVTQTPYTYNDSLIEKPKLKVAPIMTFTLGADYFFWKYLNFFTAINFVHGTHIANFGNSFPLDELRFSAGLGWNLRFIKKRNQ